MWDAALHLARHIKQRLAIYIYIDSTAGNIYMGRPFNYFSSASAASPSSASAASPPRTSIQDVIAIKQGGYPSSKPRQGIPCAYLSASAATPSSSKAGPPPLPLSNLLISLLKPLVHTSQKGDAGEDDEARNMGKPEMTCHGKACAILQKHGIDIFAAGEGMETCDEEYQWMKAMSEKIVEEYADDKQALTDFMLRNPARVWAATLIKWGRGAEAMFYAPAS